MLWLLAILHLFIGATMAGSFMIAALVLGHDSVIQIVIAARAGFALAFPVSWVVSRRLYELR